VKHKYILATLLGALVLITSSCGTSDKVASVTVTAVSVSGGFADLKGIGGTVQLTVTANYTSGKTVDETNWSTYAVTAQGTDDSLPNGIPLQSPPKTVTISPTGMLTAVDPAVCTWTNMGTVQTPSWFLTGDYQIVATYKGIASQPIYIGVASAAATSGDGTCGPS
jgi:hypothetical protein